MNPNAMAPMMLQDIFRVIFKKGSGPVSALIRNQIANRLSR